jgi:hypothetical protein
VGSNPTLSAILLQAGNHPDASGLRATLDLFGIKAVVTKAERPGLTAILDTPPGQVTL